jgi:hypothetical protein
LREFVNATLPNCVQEQWKLHIEVPDTASTDKGRLHVDATSEVMVIALCKEFDH